MSLQMRCLLQWKADGLRSYLLLRLRLQKKGHWLHGALRFSRAKRLLRTYVAVPRTEEGYGLYMAEFVWRTRFLRRTELQPEWRWHVLWALLRALRAVWKVPINASGWNLVDLAFCVLRFLRTFLSTVDWLSGTLCLGATTELCRTEQPVCLPIDQILLCHPNRFLFCQSRFLSQQRWRKPFTAWGRSTPRRGSESKGDELSGQNRAVCWTWAWQMDGITAKPLRCGSASESCETSVATVTTEART